MVREYTKWDDQPFSLQHFAESAVRAYRIAMTPPMAPAIFYLRGIAPPEITTNEIFRGIIAYMFLQLLGIALVTIFPDIALWLPSKLIGF